MSRRRRVWGTDEIGHSARYSACNAQQQRSVTLITISKFWLDRAAGIPLGPAWAEKDAQIALAGDNDVTVDVVEAIGRRTKAVPPRRRRPAVEFQVQVQAAALTEREAA